ncbi:MAG: hypothetical protein NTY53_15635, partial [Kiritimatiellaeota bacterium]|nr:hypothetical protein [Kiritimatiellota bacterium]
KTIQELYEERKRLDGAIAALESVLEANAVSPGANPPSRRGRKSMSREERLKVSQRMRKYWAARRKKAPLAARG